MDEGEAGKMTEDKAKATAFEEGMTYVERLDFREQAHRHEMEKVQLQEANATKRAKYELREVRQDTYKTIGIGVLVVVLILGIVYAIYRGTSGPESDEPSGEERRETACVENGGGFVPDDLLEDGAASGLCVFPGKTASVPQAD